MAIPPVFETMKHFGFIHHRALNARDKFLAAVAEAEKRSDLEHVLEGDLCWFVQDGRKEFYFRHPNLLTDKLDLKQIDRQIEEGTLFTLNDILGPSHPSLRYIIELKTGVGDLHEALKEVAGRLQESIPSQYWFDGFSLRLLRTVKQLESRAPTSLHTKLVMGGWVLRSAPEFFPLSLHRVRQLDAVDAITLTYNTSPARLFRALGATIDGTCEAVRQAGKVLILGGLTSLSSFELARDSMAKAGYAKFPLSNVPVRS